MKKWTLLLIGMLLSVCVLSSVSFAYNPAKQHARQVYRRTATILVEAQDAARMGHRYQGLNRAISHQRLAKDYYYTRNFEMSINHSLRAREIAFDVINNNSHRRSRRPDFDSVELRYRNNMRSNDLDTKVSDDGDEEDSLKVKINLDL